jgi:septal ring factor EnvC (AmiA/AmiB activator)
MKQLIIIATLFLSSLTYAQEIKATNESVSFNNGSHPAVVVTIPYANKEMVEKALKSEMKDWGGKYDNSKGEFMAMQASMKAMGDKYFDGYAKIIESGNEIRVAFAVDLGGAYMDIKEHSAQWKVIEERAKKFAAETAMESIEDEISAEAKILKEMEKQQSEMESDIESSKKDIEDYKKRIAEEEQQIKDNESNIAKKKEEIATQSKKLEEIEKKKKSIK